MNAPDIKAVFGNANVHVHICRRQTVRDDVIVLDFGSRPADSSGRMPAQVNRELVHSDAEQEHKGAADNVTVMVRLQGFLRSDGRVLNSNTHAALFAQKGGIFPYKMRRCLELESNHNFGVGLAKNL